MDMTKIAVMKIGSKSIADETGKIRERLLGSIARDIVAAHYEGWQVAIVSSGAVVCGKNDPGLKGPEATDQVFSMVGQRHLLNHWAEAFRGVGLIIGQGLYTNRMLASLPERKKIIYDGLIGSFRCGVVPVLNENDGAVLDELKELRDEGDNDHLSSLVGCLLNASLLVSLTTVPGVMDPIGGKLIKKIDARDKEILGRFESWPGQSNGGMVSKVRWGQYFACNTGGRAVIKKYDAHLPLTRAIRGVHTGTSIELL